MDAASDLLLGGVAAGGDDATGGAGGEPAVVKVIFMPLGQCWVIPQM